MSYLGSLRGPGLCNRPRSLQRDVAAFYAARPVAPPRSSRGSLPRGARKMGRRFESGKKHRCDVGPMNMTTEDEEMLRGWFRNPHRAGLSALIFLSMLFSATESGAIPAFARQYGTSCSTCHIDFPKLNDFGKAFKDAGFKFPKGDEDFIKVPVVMLGAPAQKELWPHTVFPGTIPGLPPIGLRFNQFFQYTSGNANNYNFASPNAGPYIPRTDFQPGFFSIFMAGNFGSGIAFWVDDDISGCGAWP